MYRKLGSVFGEPLLLHKVKIWNVFSSSNLHLQHRSRTRIYGSRSLNPHPAVPISPDYGTHALSRCSFPPGFTFGCASSAYQVEGAWNVDGKGPSNWDNFTHSYPDRIEDRSNGDNATNSYYLYKEDVQLLKDMNVDAYRFSISWSRVLPNGKVDGGRGINHKGLEYYNKLIDELIAKGLKPMVTILHFDLPQALQDEYGGLLNETNFIKDFHDYADLLFSTFGDRVKQWITINEPTIYVLTAYDIGSFPPNRCSAWKKNSCFGGNSGTEPYLATHNLLLAHADVVNLYRTQYKEKQKGTIGISIPGVFPLPFSDSTDDYLATRRYLDFSFGWFLNPITYGHYPPIMQELVGKRLPEFTSEQSLLLQGSIDFLGFNYYTSFYVSNVKQLPNFPLPESYSYDMRVQIHYNNSEGKLVGEKLGVSWQHSYPKGIWDYLQYIKSHYNDPIIYITENGASEVDNPNLPLEVILNDNFRIKYHFEHLAFLKKAIDDGVRVRGYFGWSILDNFEWLEGYSIRFGFVYVDYNTFKRYPKLSTHWFKRFLQK